MASPDKSSSEEEAPPQFGTMDTDNLALAAKSANISIDNGVPLPDDPSEMGSPYQQHVFNLVIANSELDKLVKSMGVSWEVAHHAKSLYSQVYNFGNFEGREFQHDTLIAACVYISCSDKDQPRSMTDVFKSSQATTQQMWAVYGTLKKLFSDVAEARRLSSKADKRPEETVTDTSEDADSGEQNVQTLQEKARRLYSKADKRPEGTVTDTSEDADSGEQTVQSLQEKTDQLALEEPSDPAVNRRDGILKPHSSPTAPAPASTGTNGTIKCKDPETTASAAPDTASVADASHDPPNSDKSHNATSTPPPTAPASPTASKSPSATQDVPIRQQKHSDSCAMQVI